MNKEEETELEETRQINSWIHILEEEISQPQVPGNTASTNEDAFKCIDPDLEGEENIYYNVITMNTVKDLNIDEDHYKIARSIDINGCSSKICTNEQIVDGGVNQEDDYYKIIKTTYQLETFLRDFTDEEKLPDGGSNLPISNEFTRDDDDDGGQELDDVYVVSKKEEPNDDIDKPAMLESTCSPEDNDIYQDVVKESTCCQGNESSIGYTQSWYWKDADRDKVEKALNNHLDEEGRFVVRDSKRGGPKSPNAISVIHDGTVFHVLVRVREDGRMAIGKPKFGEKKFSNLKQLVEFYKNNDLTLFDDHGRVIGVVQLTDPPGDHL